MHLEGGESGFLVPLQRPPPVVQWLRHLSNSFAILFFPFGHVDQTSHFELFLNGTSSV